MNLNYLEAVTEKILTELGISQNEYDGFIIFILIASVGYSIAYWIFFKIKCKELSCKKINKIFENSEKVSIAIDKLEKLLNDIHYIDISDHSHMKENIDKVDIALSDVKSKVSELNGIMLVRETRVSSSRRRIEHEDD